MKKSLLLFSVTLALAGASAYSFADAPTTPTTPTTVSATAPAAAPLTMVDLLKKLDQAGYKNIHQIKFDHGNYLIETVNAQCEKEKFKVSADNGVIPAQAQAQAQAKNYLSMLAVTEKLQADGYKTIQAIEFDHGVYKAKVSSDKDKKIKVTINASTGTISKD